MASKLKVDPPEEVRFEGPFDIRVVTSRLTLKNPSDKRLLYRIKTSLPRVCSLQPNDNVLSPFASRKIRLLLHPFDYQPYKRTRYKFWVESIVIPEFDENSTDGPEEVWSEAKPEDVHKVELACLLDLPEPFEAFEEAQAKTSLAKTASKKDDTSQASAASMEANDLECSICCEMFTDPRLLTCGHLLCFTCLVSWIKANSYAKCPLCRYAIVHPRHLGNRDYDDMQNVFPADLAMARRVEAERIVKQSHQCCVCEGVDATAICLDCRDTFCAACTKVHQKQSVSRQHITEDLASLTVQKLIAGGRELCPNHSNVPCAFYCASHSVSVCSHCAETEHKDCPEVKRCKKKMKEAKRSLQSCADIFSEHVDVLDLSISTLDQFVQKCGVISTFTETTTRKFFSKLHTLVDLCCNLTLEKFAYLQSQSVLNAQTQMSRLAAEKGRLMNFRRAISRANELTMLSDTNQMMSVMGERLTDMVMPPFPAHLSLNMVLPDLGEEVYEQVERVFKKLVVHQTAFVTDQSHLMHDAWVRASTNNTEETGDREDVVYEVFSFINYNE